MDLFADNESVAAAADVTRTSLFTSWRAGAELGNDSSERARFSSTPFNQQQHPSPLMLPSTHCTHIEHEGLGNGSIVRAVSTDEAAEQTTSCYERSNDFISSEGGEVTAEPLQNVRSEEECLFEIIIDEETNNSQALLSQCKLVSIGRACMERKRGKESNTRKKVRRLSTSLAFGSQARVSSALRWRHGHARTTWQFVFCISTITP